MAAETELTIQEKFDKAIARVQAKDLAIHVDRSYCCTSCGVYEIDQEYGDTPVAYLTNAQNHDLWWEDGIPWFLEEGSRANGDPERCRPAEKVWFHYNDIKAATAVALSFSAEGFDVDWEGSEDQGVGVTLMELFAPPRETSLNDQSATRPSGDLPFSKFLDSSKPGPPDIDRNFGSVGEQTEQNRPENSDIFSRFLDPSRQSPPDIDVRFARPQEPQLPYIPRSDEEQEQDVLDAMPRFRGPRKLTVWDNKE